MNGILTASKEYFSDSLSKGRIIPFEQLPLVPQDEGQALLKKWYHNITICDFLPKFNSELEEICIHSPTNIILKTNTGKEFFESDLTQDDLDLLVDFYVVKNQINWNASQPFASFFCTIRERKVRMTLINGSCNLEGQNKIFIRFLNEKVIPVHQYGHHSIDWLEMVLSQKNILISGATGSGKTTFLNSLVALTPVKEHVVILEDTREIIAPHSNSCQFLAKPQSEEHSLLAYLKYAMRISPDRIILGELRSQEVETMLLALNSGHNGVMSTIHANSANASLEKLSLLFQMYSTKDLDYKLVLKLVCSNIDYVIHMEDKKIKQIISVFGSEGDQIFFEELISL